MIRLMLAVHNISAELFESWLANVNDDCRLGHKCVIQILDKAIEKLERQAQ